MAILFPFDINWSDKFTVESTYKTEIITSRDKSEQRFALRVQPRKVVSFKVNPARGDAPKLLTLAVKNLQGEFVVPEYSRPVFATGAVANGQDTVPLGSPLPVWARSYCYVVIETTLGKELRQIVSMTSDSIILDSPISGDLAAGNKVYPGIVGRLDPSMKSSLLTSSVGAMQVTLNADPMKNPVWVPEVPVTAPLPGEVTTNSPLGTNYFSLTDLGVSAADVDAGLISIVSIHQFTITGVGLGIGMDLTANSQHDLKFYADNGSGAHATSPLTGQSFTYNTTPHGSDYHVWEKILAPGTRWVQIRRAITLTFPIYSYYTASGPFFIKHPETGNLDDQGEVPEISFYNGKPLMMLRPNWASTVDINAQSYLEQLDFDIGPIDYYSYTTLNDVAMKAVFTRRNQKQSEAIIQLFHGLKGKQGEFYTPTWLDDFDISLGAAFQATSIDIPGSDLFVSYGDLALFKSVIILFRDRTFQALPIESITLVGGNSRVSFGDYFAKAINPTTVRQMCWLPNCRMAMDTLTLDYETNTICTTQLTYKFLKDQPT